MGLTTFVKHIRYKVPPDTWDKQERGKVYIGGLFSPVQVLLYGKGDCDSKNLLMAVLFGNLLDYYNYGMAFGLLDGDNLKNEDDGHIAFIMEGIQYHEKYSYTENLLYCGIQRVGNEILNNEIYFDRTYLSYDDIRFTIFDVTGNFRWSQTPTTFKDSAFSECTVFHFIILEDSHGRLVPLHKLHKLQLTKFRLAWIHRHNK